MTSRRRRTVATCVILGAMVACSHAPSSGASPSTGPIMVVFKNESLEQADVFAVRRGGGALRLGTVFAGHTDTLTIREGTLPPGELVDFVARLLTRPVTPHSGPVAVHPGEWLEVTLPTTANMLAVLPAR